MSKRDSLDVLLINPGGRRRVYQSLGDTLTAIEPPVWAGLLATFARERGFTVEILDAEADDIPPDEVAALAVFLANEEAQVLNGQSFNLCGCVCFD